MKASIKIFYFLITISFVLFIFPGCEKIRENQISGTWTHIELETSASENSVEWEFSSNSILIRRKESTNEIDTSYYFIEQEHLRSFIHLSNFGEISEEGGATPGVYEIAKLTNKKLTLNLRSPNTRIEFVKK